MKIQNQPTKGIQGFIRRLIKIVYVVSIVSLIIISVLTGYSKKPIQRVDNQKSNFTCHNGKTYSLSSVYINFYSDPGTITDTTNKRKMWDKCLEINRSESYDKGWTDNNIDDYEIDKIRNENISIPTFEIIKYTEGSWITSAGWCALVFVIGYIIINITKETLLYLLFADNYTFGWIKRWIPSLR